MACELCRIKIKSLYDEIEVWKERARLIINYCEECDEPICVCSEKALLRCAKEEIEYLNKCIDSLKSKIEEK